MKASLLIAGVLACTLATLARSQHPNKGQKQLSPKAAALLNQKHAAQQNGGPLATAQPGGSSGLILPPNDACAAATPISGPGPHAFTTVGATTDGPNNCGNFTDDVWFNWTAGASGPYEVSLCAGASYDSEVAVYDTSACQGALLVCDDDTCAFAGPSKATFTAVGGNVYKIQVGGYNGATGAGTFTIMPPPPPPTNDACAAAIAISGPGPHAFNTVGATTDGPSNCGLFMNDVWFNWTAGASGPFDVSLCAGASYDSEVSVYDTSACQGTLLACNDDFCGAYGPSKASFTAVMGSVYKIQIGGWNGATGAGTFRVEPPPPPPANDDCSTPTTIAGAGPFNFDTTSATTGSQGQSEALCNFYATTGIDNDAWFKWTASATGQAVLSVCNQSTVDTKVAVYPGAGCPSAGALGCNDDSCGLQSTVCWPVTNGQTYTIQFGKYPGATDGSGTFGISIQAGGPSACQVDDGTSEDILGYTLGGELAWIQRFGPPSGTTSLTNVQISWGSLAAAGFCPPNGTACHVLLYDDPNDDGDPIDAVLVQQINTTVVNVDTDTFNNYPVTPVTMNGYFFVGAGMAHAQGQLVAPMDLSCVQPTLTYLFGNGGSGAVNYANPSANTDPPSSFDSNGFPCNLMVRAGCTSDPMVQNCIPGVGGVLPCPCGNPPAGSGLGCNNFGAGPANSGTLAASGVASLASDSIVLSATGENNTSTTVFWTGKGPLHPTGVVHAAGIRCVTQNLKRLYNHPASGGAVSAPIGADLSVSARTAAVGSPILSGETRYYFNIYRDPQAAGPCGNTSSTVNLTNGGSIVWGP